MARTRWSRSCSPLYASSFFFDDTATTEIYTLSLHDALPISICRNRAGRGVRATSRTGRGAVCRGRTSRAGAVGPARSEEHTSELQSRQYLVCRLLLEKKKERPESMLSARFSLKLTS